MEEAFARVSRSTPQLPKIQFSIAFWARLHPMSELAMPRKHGRPPKTTAVLGETIKRRKIDEDGLGSSPSTAKALGALRNAPALSRAPARGSMANRRDDGGHSVGASQGNNIIAADPEDESELLNSSLPGNAKRQSRMSQQFGDDISDTIVITPERRRGRPQGRKATKGGGSNRNEHSENRLLPVGLPNPGEDGLAETPTKRGRGRPRKSKTTQGSGQRVDSNAVLESEPQSPRASMPSDLERRPMLDLVGESPTKRKRGRLRKSSIDQNERRLPLAVDDEPPELPAQGTALVRQVEVLKKTVLEKLTGKRDVRLVGLDDEHGKIRQLFEQTVVAGEGNSMLVIGARGSGKSTLVEKVISEISREHREDFHTVRLNGFIHTDDRLALREIWRQLGIEMEVEDDLTGKVRLPHALDAVGLGTNLVQTSNYADILSSLLALLSHPSELSENATNRIAKSVIFVLNEFDLFASHPRQTLLYNLFDIAQGRKAPILVLGLTTRIDVVESLEKRVKSRFSHRHVHLGLPKSLGAFWEICKQALLVNEDDIQTAEQIEALLRDQEGGLLEVWNKIVEGLGNDAEFKSLLQSIFYTTKGVKDFHVACLLPIVNLSPQTFYLTGRDFIENSLAPPESKLHILEGLSDLELSLLIAAARLDIILDTDTCNFNMAYDEYATLASRVKLQSSASGAAAVGAGSKIWGREVGLGAWERLAEYNLIIPAIGGAVGGTGGGTRDVGRMGRMFRVDVGLEEIWQSMPNLGAAMAKWCREI